MNKNEIITWVIDELEGGDKVITDTGGVTKFGISKKANPDLDICSLSKADAIQIYDKRYWTPNGCDNFPFPVNLIIFDTAVNGGKVSDLKQIWNLTLDWDKLIYTRLKYYAKLCIGKTRFDPYFEGWVWRLIKLVNKIEEMT